MEDELVSDYLSRAASFSRSSTDQGLWKDCAFTGIWERRAALCSRGDSVYQLSIILPCQFSRFEILKSNAKILRLNKPYPTPLLPPSFLHPENKPPLSPNNSCVISWFLSKYNSRGFAPAVNYKGLNGTMNFQSHLDQSTLCYTAFS